MDVLLHLLMWVLIVLALVAVVGFIEEQLY